MVVIVAVDPERYEPDWYMPLREQIAHGEIDGFEYRATMGIGSGDVFVEFDTGRTSQDAVYRFDLADMIKEAHRTFEADHADPDAPGGPESNDPETGGADDGG